MGMLGPGPVENLVVGLMKTITGVSRAERRETELALKKRQIEALEKIASKE